MVDQYNASLATDPFAPRSQQPQRSRSQINAAIYPFKRELRENFDKGWDVLMMDDGHSMPTYLSFEKNLSELVCVTQRYLFLSASPHNVLHR